MTQVRLYLDEDAMRGSVVFGLRARNQERSHAGTIVAPRQPYPVGEELRRLMRLIGRVPVEEMRNRIEVLSAWF